MRDIIDSKILPEGSLQLVCGLGHGIIDHVTSEDVVTFTGSAHTGKMLKSLPRIVQESVPFNISFGGGTQGLFDAVYLDPTKRVNGIIEKFFAGTFEGGVRFIEMYSIPLYIVEIRDIIKNKLQNYNLYYPKGGRRVFIKNMM